MWIVSYTGLFNNHISSTFTEKRMAMFHANHLDKELCFDIEVYQYKGK